MLVQDRHGARAGSGFQTVGPWSEVDITTYPCARRAFSLVELVVVMAVICTLLGVLLPAVQLMRAAACRIQCANNLREIGLALHNSHDTNRHFPTGGWGWSWIGMPDRGAGLAQPGGWLYNVLPYVEQANLRGLGLGQKPPQIDHSLEILVGTPIALFNCPSRRTGGPYPVLGKYGRFRVGVGSTGKTTFLNAGALARADYAANAGSQGFNQLFAGPRTLSEGDNAAYRWPSTAYCSGIFYQRSAVSIGQITRGTSNTVLVGERYLNAAHYTDGVDVGDNEGMYAGFDNDVYRVTIEPPQKDRLGYSNPLIFGSAHSSGLNMLYCDGGVRVVSYDVDPDLFFTAGRRGD
jgi:prepilin-type N-terminal cleavage/methylation domain-containing protein/prepilin-type processing-associated H-X9-DG protein